MTNRRNFLQAAAIGAMVCPSVMAQQGNEHRQRTIFIFVHGIWHGAWCFGRPARLLSERGHGVIPVDLPGSGLTAKFPSSYYTRPFDPTAFATEMSPIANVTLGDYTQLVASVIDEVMDSGSGPIVLVGHSAGGMVLNAVGELLGQAKIKHLVYLSAYMASSGVPPVDIDLANSLTFSLLLADPAAIGALRTDPNSPDPAFRATLKATFYGDLPQDRILGIANLLTPDHPVEPFTEAINLSSRWGSIPRTYITCSEDMAIPLVVQHRFIREIDLEFPQNRTHVVTLNSAHSPFFSQPQRLAEILDDLAESAGS